METKNAEQSYEQEVAAKLRALRLKRKLTMHQVADGAGVARRAYAAWEGAENAPTGRSSKKLADFYNITQAQLFR